MHGIYPNDLDKFVEGGTEEIWESCMQIVKNEHSEDINIDRLLDIFNGTATPLKVM